MANRLWTMGRFVHAALVVMTALGALVVTGDAARAAGPTPPGGLAGTFTDAKQTFDAHVDGATGALSFSMPFALPAARGDAQPTLALTYRAGRGTAEAGEGWSLGIPAIERAPLWGFPKYRDDGVPKNEDRYTYGGAALTFVCEIGSNRDDACPSTNAVMGPWPAWANRYRYYRLQVDTSFQRFFLSPARDQWIVQQRGGVTLEFGRARTRPELGTLAVDRDDGSAANPSPKIFRWNLVRAYDLHGTRNLTVYSWTDLAGRKHLTDIHYTPPASGWMTAALAAFSYHVQLSWEAPTYAQFHHTRMDKRRHFMRLKRVAIASKTWTATSVRELVRAYNLTYYAERGILASPSTAPVWNRSYLSSVTMESRCDPAVPEAGGQIPQATGCPSLPSTTFEYENAHLVLAGSFVGSAVQVPGGGDGLKYVGSTAVLDVDGNGLPDIVQAWPQNFQGLGRCENGGKSCIPDTALKNCGEDVACKGFWASSYNDCKDHKNYGIFDLHTGVEVNEWFHLRSSGALGNISLVCQKDGVDPLNEGTTYYPDSARRAREHVVYVNRGPTVTGSLSLQHHCLDAGDGTDGTLSKWQIAPLPNAPPGSVPGSHAALFSQWGAEAMGPWGQSLLLWSRAENRGFAIQPADPHTSFCSDLSLAAKKWRETPTRPYPAVPPSPAVAWPRNAGRMGFEPALAMVDIDGDGYLDQLVRTPGAEDRGFESAMVTFTRRFSHVESEDRTPALLPFDSTTHVHGPFVITGEPSVGRAPDVLGPDVVYADVDGDGLVDLVSFDDLAAFVRPGNGRGHFGCEDRPDPACVAGDPATAASTTIPGLGRAYRINVPDAAKPWPTQISPFLVRQVFFQDVTGDGLADIVVFEPKEDIVVFGPKDLNGSPVPNGRLKLWVNVDGHTFRCLNLGTHCVVATLTDPDQPSVTLNRISLLDYRATFADIDGNGSQDFVLLGNKGVWHFSFVSVTPATASPRAPRPGLLTRIRSGVGADTEISYRTIQELDLAANSTVQTSFYAPWASKSPQVVPVVTKIVTRDTTGVITGTSLPAPYGFTRTTTYAYRNPAYDAWDRSFKGFRRVRVAQSDGHVIETRYWFGPCEGSDVEASLAVGACPAGSDNNGTKAFVGLPVRIDRKLEASDLEQLGWFSTTTLRYEHRKIHPPGAAPDRDVHFTLLNQVDEYLYDTGSLVTELIGDIQIEAPTSLQHAPAQAQRVHLVTTFAYDAESNLTTTTRLGRMTEPQETFTLDPKVVERLGPENRCAHAARPTSGEWACLVNTIKVEGEPRVGETNPDRLEKLREVFFTRRTSDGEITRIDAWLGHPYYVPLPDEVGDGSSRYWSPKLHRKLTFGVDAPQGDANLMNDTRRTVAVRLVDEFGNARWIYGGVTTMQPCTSVLYDDAYKQFPKSVTAYAETSCTGGALTTELVVDRGLGAVVSQREPNGAVTRIKHDVFGRVAEVFAPAPDGGAGTTTLAAQITYETHAPTPHVKIARYVTDDTPVRSVEIFNALGEHVLGFDQADPIADGAPWIARSWAQRDGAGRVVKQYRPFFFHGSADAVAMFATAVTPQGRDLATEYDPFGRVTFRLDGTAPVGFYTAEYRHRPLAVDIQDAEQRKPSGPYAGLFTTVSLDGHGRVEKTIARNQANVTTTTVKYLGTGEPRSLCRFEGSSADCDNPIAGTYKRTMVWDSFSRLRANDEPNTHRWVYAYDDAGRLVATSDARGCGKNLYYDALSRVVAEDFSPCEADQPPYTVPDPVTGDGTEAFYRYDTYEPGQVVQEPDFLDREEHALGRLVAMKDRGSATLFNYDSRGRVRRETRRIAKPGAPASALANRYAANTFTQRTDFDIGNRLTVRSTGLARPELLVNGRSEETYAYSARGALRTIGGSYGNLVNAIQFSASGRLLSAKYTDAATSRVDLYYDARERLQRVHINRPLPAAIWSNPLLGYSTPPPETTQLDIADLWIGLDDVSNPTSITDASQATWPAGTKPVTRTMQYDGFYRLKEIQYAHGGDDHIPPFMPEAVFGDRHPVAEVRGSRRVQQQSFTYDAHGNMTSSLDNESLRFDRSLGGIVNGRPTQNGPLDGPHQLVDAHGIHAEYDQAGNMTELTVARDTCWVAMPHCSHRFKYDWNEVGQLARARRWDYPAGAVPGFDPNNPPVWDLAYAYSNGARTLISTTKDAATEGLHTLDVFETLRMTSTRYRTTLQDYRIRVENEVGFVGGVGRVFYDLAGGLPQGNGSARHVYLHVGDHLGSTAVVIDKDSGEIVERTMYQAFGALDADFRTERWSNFRAEHKFTGKETDIEVGLTYFGARYYQANLGRWASADPLTIHGLGSDLNPYAYMRGWVMSHVDPFGLEPIPVGARDIQWHGAYWSAMVGDQLEVGLRDPPQTPERMTRDQRGYKEERVMRDIVRGLLPAWPLSGGLAMKNATGSPADVGAGFRNEAVSAAQSILSSAGGGAPPHPLAKDAVDAASAKLASLKTADPGTTTSTAGRGLFHVATIVAPVVGELRLAPGALARILSTSASSEELAQAVLSVGRGGQTVAVLETAEGVRLVGGGVKDLSPLQRIFSSALGLVPVKLAGVHAEGTTIMGAISRGLTPVRGVTTTNICWVCERDLTEGAFGIVFELVGERVFIAR